MRGQKEQECFEIVRKAIFTKNGETIYHPFTKKTYFEVSDEEFSKEQMWFINSDCCKNYFGLLREDRIEIEQILRNAQPNEKASEFPDFIFSNGFIEHFQVSSSKTTRKGAKHTKEMSCFISKVNREKEDLEQKWNQSPSFDKIRSEQWIMDNPEHSHTYLISSFENNWKNHIESLNKYTGNKNVGIFMVEYPEFALSMCENVYADWKDGMSHGDMREQEQFRSYRLSRDKKMLNFIYHYKEQIKYIIFVYYTDFEIIRLENIPYLLNLIPWDYVIYPMAVKTISSLYNITVPQDFSIKGQSENG